MSLRFLCREVNDAAACHVGGPVAILHCAFDDAAALERWLRAVGERPSIYRTRELLGVELLPPLTALEPA